MYGWHFQSVMIAERASGISYLISSPEGHLRVCVCEDMLTIRGVLIVRWL